MLLPLLLPMLAMLSAAPPTATAAADISSAVEAAVTARLPDITAAVLAEVSDAAPCGCGEGVAEVARALRQFCATYGADIPTARECSGARPQLVGRSVVHQLQLSNAEAATPALCRFDQTGSWTVLMRRRLNNGTLDFNRTLAEYTAGFGDVTADDGEFWWGLQRMHALTAPARNGDVEFVAQERFIYEGDTRTVDLPYFAVHGADEDFTLEWYDGGRSHGRFRSAFGARDSADTRDADTARRCGGGFWLELATMTGKYLTGVQKDRSVSRSDWIHIRQKDPGPGPGPGLGVEVQRPGIYQEPFDADLPYHCQDGLDDTRGLLLAVELAVHPRQEEPASALESVAAVVCK